MRNMLLVFIIAMVVMIPMIAHSQAPDTAWIRTYNFGYNSEGWSVRETSDGGMILAGSGMPNYFGDWDIFLIKTNSNGELNWIQNCCGLLGEEGRVVKQTPDGGYFVAGWIRPTATGGRSIVLIKSDAEGQTIWSRTFSDYDDQEIRSIELTQDGGYVLAGWAQFAYHNGDSSYQDILIIRSDSLGNQIWRKHYGAVNSQKAWSIKNTFDGGFVIAGWTDIYPQGSDIYVLKLNQGGDTLWTRTFGGLCNDGATSVLELPNHNIVIGGSRSDDRCEGHATLIFLSQNSDSLNSVALPYTRINSMSITNDSNIVTIGPQHEDNSVIYIVKLSLNGDILWTKTLENLPIAFSARSIIQTSDSGYVFTGTTQSYPENIVLVKLAPDQSQNISDDSPILPTKILLEQNYPNPFNSSTLFTYRLSEKGHVAFSIYNLLGQKVANVVDGDEGAGEHQIIWNSGTLASGVYFARLTTAENSQSIKLLLMK